MSDRSVRGLKKEDLLELIVEQRKRIEELEAELADQKARYEADMASAENRLRAVLNEAEARLDNNTLHLSIDDIESWSTTLRKLADLFEGKRI